MSWASQLSPERLAADLETLGEWGRRPSGAITRLALSKEDAAARKFLAARMRDELGLQIRTDDVGNLFALRPGLDENMPAILTGSHIDSVPEGGRFDGPLGIMAPLEVIRTWNQEGIRTRRPVEVVIFVGEEGSRFRCGTIGSSAVAGDRAVSEILALKDDDGISYAEALLLYGDSGPPRPCPAPREAYYAYVELHVEQGGVLEAKALTIGDVEAICGLSQWNLTFEGEANHAGATPMDLRHDALAGAAYTITSMIAACKSIGGGAVATAGRLSVEPGAYNIIPSKAVVGFDLRAPTKQGLDDLERALAGASGQAMQSLKVKCTNQLRQRVEPGAMSPIVVDAIERAAAAARLGWHRMPSGAIHDALHMANLVPSGMIFVPSRGGRSHCPEELTSPDAMIRGAEVLGRTILELAEER